MSRILYAASSMSHINNFHRDYIKALTDMGHEVQILARGDGADHNVPFEKRIFSRKNAECRRMISKIVRDGGFDAVLLNTTLAAFHIRLAIRGKNRPRIVNFVHGYLFSRHTGIIKRRILLLCEKILKSRTDAIIVMNKEDLGIAEKNALTKGKVYFTNGMGIKPRVPHLSRNEVRAMTKDENSYVMTFVGELSGRKNQEFLIRALKRVREYIPSAVLWLVGDGGERQRLEAVCAELSLSDSVRFVGQTPYACDYMRASDLYVSAAVSEGLPFNIIEAASCRLPILASRVKGQEDIIIDGECGCLYTLGDTEQFVEMVRRIHSGEISLSADRIFERYEHYSSERVFDDTLATVIDAMDIER